MGITPLSLQAGKFKWRSETVCCQSQNGTGSGKKLIYVIFGSTDLATTPSPKSTWNISVVYQHPEAVDGPLRLQNALALVCVGGWGCLHSSLHRLHMWLIAPHVLWCCFRMLHSFRSFLVPNPYLYTSCSGNSFVFSSPEYSRVLICSLRTGVPHNSFFFFSHTDILGN